MEDKRRYNATHKVLSALCVALVLIGFVWLSMVRLGRTFDFMILWPYRIRLRQGFVMTVILSAGSLVLSTLIGTLAAAGQLQPVLAVRYFCRTYIQIIRGTPLLVQIYFFYFLIGTAWGIDNRYVAGIIVLSIFEGAYIAEMIRGGLLSIDPGHYEIAKSIGLTPVKTFRLVTLPVLLSRIVPSLAGQFASIIKDSSLLSVIALIELTQTTQEITATNFRMFENYLFVGLLYFMLTFPVSLLSQVLERRVRHANRA